MTDASIILSGNKPINHSRSIAEAMGLVQTAIDAPNQSKMLGEQVRNEGLQNDYQAMVNQRVPTMLDQQMEKGRIANATGNLSLESQQQLQYLRNAAPDAYQMSQLIDAGQPDRARALLAKRIKMLQEQGRDSSDSEAIMQQMEAGNIDGVKSELGTVVNTAIRANVFGQNSQNAKLDYFRQMTQGLSADQAEKARLIELGLEPRAMGSSAITIAEQGLTVPVANSEAVISGAKARSSENAKLTQQGALKPQIEADVTTAKGNAQNKVNAADEFNKKVRNADGADAVLDMAEPLLEEATGSYVGAAVDMAGQVVGISNKGAQAAAQLKALEGSLIMNMPRMEGPQSDRDSNLYRQMAAQLGDATTPTETRKAAIKALRQMNARYKDNPTGSNQYSGQIGRSQSLQQKAPQGLDDVWDAMTPEERSLFR